MRRFWVVGGFLALGIALVYASFALRATNPNDRHRIVNLAKDEERSNGPQFVALTRLGPTQGAARGVQTFKGLLVDAGCRDRASAAAGMPASRPAPAVAPQGGLEAPAAQGDLVPQEVKENRVPDVATRQMDMGCGITGATAGFALLMDSGPLVNLDEGGNTFAWQAVTETAEGRAILEGKQGSVKPRAVVEGTLKGDRLVVDTLRLER